MRLAKEVVDGSEMYATVEQAALATRRVLAHSGLCWDACEGIAIAAPIRPASASLRGERGLGQGARRACPSGKEGM